MQNVEYISSYSKLTLNKVNTRPNVPELRDDEHDGGDAAISLKVDVEY